MLTNREDSKTGDKKAGSSLVCSDHEIWSSVSGKEETRQEARLQLWTLGELTLTSSGMLLEESMESSTVGKWGSRGLVDSQGSLPPDSRTVPPNEQEVRQRCVETCVDV